MVAGDDAAGVPQARRESESKLVAPIDFVDRHQRALAHLARHHGVGSRLGKYEAERDCWFFHQEARKLRRQSSHRKKTDMSPCIFKPPRASFVLRRIKKDGIALTGVAAVRHNKIRN